MDYSSSGSSLPEISQARILKWVAISFSIGSFWPRNRTVSPALTDGFITTELPGKPNFVVIWDKDGEVSCLKQLILCNDKPHIHIYLLKNYIWAGDFSHLDKNWVHPNGEGQRNYVKDLRPVFALPVSPDCILGNYYLSLTLSKISDSFQFDNVTIVLSWDLSQRKTLYKWSFRYQDSFLEPWQVCNPIECQLFYILGIWFWSLLRPGNICKCFWIWITFIRVPRWEVNGRT